MVSEECSLERTLIRIRNVCKTEKRKRIRSLVNICCGTVFRHSEKKRANRPRSVSKANLSRCRVAAKTRTPLCNICIWSARCYRIELPNYHTTVCVQIHKLIPPLNESVCLTVLVKLPSVFLPINDSDNSDEGFEDDGAPAGKLGRLKVFILAMLSSIPFLLV